jgi:hypothetical protein
VLLAAITPGVNLPFLGWNIHQHPSFEKKWFIFTPGVIEITLFYP